MDTVQDYKKIDAMAQLLFDTMAQRVTKDEVNKIKEAYEYAKAAHHEQRRKSGEPYIVHPLEVALIVAQDMMLGAKPVIAALLHDVVEDTEHTLEQIQELFGKEVAFLVAAVTKPQNSYEMTRQLDNFKQMLVTFQFDIRALLLKIADRLHNMKTLKHLAKRKQLKIACETDMFYAPFANRLGLYNIKVELENLSLQFRSKQEYEELEKMMENYKLEMEALVTASANKIRSILSNAGIEVDVQVNYLRPYSVMRKIARDNNDFNHVPFKHQLRVVYRCENVEEEKNMALRIYSLLTDNIVERPGSFINYINTPKETGYKAIHVQLLADYGSWEMVQITSERMMRHNQLGCIAERSEDNVESWIEKFRSELKEMMTHIRTRDFIETVTLSLYNDDITVFSPKGEAFKMSPRATALDFAFEINGKLGLHAKTAHINGQLAPVTTMLKMGDVVRIDKDDNHLPEAHWISVVATDKAAYGLRRYFASLPKLKFKRCQVCMPIPGEDIMGFRSPVGQITVHRRDCQTAIRNATKNGDSIVDAQFEEEHSRLYPVAINIMAVDRYHLLSDIIQCITDQLELPIDQLNTITTDSIVNTYIAFSVHSFNELQTVIRTISLINSVEKVRRTTKK